MPENMVVYNIVCLLSPLMWDGERLSAYGIQKALEWSYIDEEDHPFLARKIVTYFAEVKNQHAAKQKAQSVSKKPQKRR